MVVLFLCLLPSLLPVQVEEPGNAKTVKQFHFTSWPDFGVPLNGGPLLKFLLQVRKHHEYTNPKPLLVHCRCVRVCVCARIIGSLTPSHHLSTRISAIAQSQMILCNSSDACRRIRGRRVTTSVCVHMCVCLCAAFKLPLPSPVLVWAAQGLSLVLTLSCRGRTERAWWTPTTLCFT